MRLSKAEIRAILEQLQAQLLPWGVDSSEKLAALLRDPDNPDNPGFPSGGYVRLMLSPFEAPRPGEVFCDRVLKLAEYVGRELAGEAPNLALVRDRLAIREDRYGPAGRLRFVQVPREIRLDHLYLPQESPGGEALVLVAVPEGWLKQCWLEECGVWFPARSSQARYCSREHRRMAANRRRRERMTADGFDHGKNQTLAGS